MTYPQNTQATKVSGPGPLSQRTDQQPMRAPTGLPYGEAKALTDSQRAVPLPETTASPAPPPLSAPTTQPSQPITAGAALGAGPGVEALNPGPAGAPSGGAVSQALARVAAIDNSGVFAQMLAIAQQRGL